MALTFYPNPEDVKTGSLESRIDVLMDAAERYKAIILDMAARAATEESERRRGYIPRDQGVAFNWEEIASALREIRELPESTKQDKTRKAEFLTKLAEIYEVLRGAKMSKLEAVRLALISEANHLRGSSTQVA
jgi:hypothetical protein